MTIPTISPMGRRQNDDQPAKEQWINSLTDMITVHPWHDPDVEAKPNATPTASVESGIWWTPSVGCLGMAIAARFSTYAASAPSTWAVDDIGTVGHSGRVSDASAARSGARPGP